MTGWLRPAALALIVAGGLALVAALHRSRPEPPMPATWTTSFQILGAPLKLADRAVTRVLPIDEVDERTLGDTFRATYDRQVDPSHPDQAYLDALVSRLAAFAGKPFPYRAYVIDYPGPNAMAFPGGVLLVTRPLLRTLRSEAELVSVLAHEIGHVERGHCFDAVRFELLARKARVEPLGSVADFAAALLLRHAYSKTMEHEADEYAFELLTHSRYDPRGVSGAFRALESLEGTPAPAGLPNPIRDYVASHPPLAIRASEFGQRADAWWLRHAGETRYVGRRNLSERAALAVREYPGEAVTR